MRSAECGIKNPESAIRFGLDLPLATHSTFPSCALTRAGDREWGMRIVGEALLTQGFCSLVIFLTVTWYKMTSGPREGGGALMKVLFRIFLVCVVLTSCAVQQPPRKRTIAAP